ncbi:excinuclease ABC subunit UvrA [Bacteroidota bacterium]
MPEIKRDKEFISIRGARVHNLKNVSLDIPRNKLIVITGLSGSGKSSLALDTIYAEGQRRYVESLSSYARQFLGRINKPDVDSIMGIPPAVAIEQKVNTQNPRSTVGTTTELYDYIKLLFARIGKTYSPASNTLVKNHTVNDVVEFVTNFKKNTKVLLLIKYGGKNNLISELENLLKRGNTRIEINDEIVKISDVLTNKNKEPLNGFNIVIDRLVVNHEDDFKNRLADSVQSAFFEGQGDCIVKAYDENKVVVKNFSNRFEADGIKFEEPTVHMFTFNNPIGACKKCEGFGQVIGIDEDLVIPDKNLSIYNNAVACWKGEKMQEWKNELVNNASKFNFPIHKPFYELSIEQKKLLWTGNQYFNGLNAFFRYLESKNYKIQYRVMLARYRGKTICPDCQGTRLKKEAGYVKVSNKNIPELVQMPIEKLKEFFNKLVLTDYEKEVSKRVLTEINNRLEYLCNVGLGYLTLNRTSSSLSGGESQRINLATILGSSLVGSLYILDEPSIGLHPRDTYRLIGILKKLKTLGNSVLVVEHDEDIIKSSDELVDIGPKAGRLGGEIVYQGDHQNLIRQNSSLTANYLTGKLKIQVPQKRRNWQNYIEIVGAYENNLKGVKVKFPLNVITVVTGVSGSGKTSLVKNVLYAALNKYYNGIGEKAGHFGNLQGNLQNISNVEFIDQNPIGKSSRSNPATYIKAYDEIRKLFAAQPYAIVNNYKASFFSFNIDGGRCEECQGEGIIKVEMQFMADVELICESCNGKKFKDDILEVKYRFKNIHDILEMTINEAIDFFGSDKDGKRVASKLHPLKDVGLGYLRLGQSSSTLSGGESQRVKLASFLSKENKNINILFIFDEPTTGLHFHDIKVLLQAFNALVENGHTVLIIEHNLEIIKNADWIIDLGPEGGEKGGNLVFAGVPEDLIKLEHSYTGKYLKNKINSGV